jgi:hypothetical protein
LEKIRVYELAKEMNTTSKRLMEKLAEINIIVKNHMSLLEEHELEIDPPGFSRHVLVAWVAHPRYLDRCVGRALFVHDVVGVVLKGEVLARVSVHQVSGDFLLIPCHGYRSSTSTTGLPRLRAWAISRCMPSETP